MLTARAGEPCEARRDRSRPAFVARDRPELNQALHGEAAWRSDSRWLWPMGQVCDPGALVRSDVGEVSRRVGRVVTVGSEGDPVVEVGLGVGLAARIRRLKARVGNQRAVAGSVSRVRGSVRRVGSVVDHAGAR